MLCVPKISEYPLPISILPTRPVLELSMELNKKLAYNLTTKQNVAYGQVTDSELEENAAYDQVTELVENSAYGCNQEERENISEPSTKPLDLDQDKVDTLAVNKNSFRETATVRVERVYRTSTTIASIALVLSILALLVAIVGISFSTQVTMSTLQQKVQILQAELNDSKNEVMILQNVLNLSNAKQDAIISSILTRSLGTFWNPATSCSFLAPGSPSGDYWIQTNGTTNPVQVYCDMNRTSCSCNTTGGWMRVANLDMIDPNQNCPAGFQLDTEPRRTCERPESAECASTTFQTYGVEYSHVCGRVIGYQHGTPDAFLGSNIDSTYVDGISLTHGQSPRKHIWTFAGALDEIGSARASICPCTQSDIPYTGPTIPSFVGQDYFCDTGSRNAFQLIFYPDDPLWDGQGCGGTSTCCEFNNPPWFCKQLPLPTTDDIELRLCGDEATNNEDTPIEQVEIYVY